MFTVGGIDVSLVPHVLFPVDFSERCHAVKPHVVSLAQHFKAKVTLLNVIHIPREWYAGVEGAYPVTFDIDAMMADGRKQLETFFGSPELGSTIDPVVCQGDPATEITSYAEAHDVGLIMMPTHGYGKFRGLLLGSVTAKVLYDAKCAVWTAAHTENPKLAGDQPIRNIRLVRVICG
jgi:nucleotide-binding universal stress UspA family protein